jgi:hypothetical protein
MDRNQLRRLAGLPVQAQQALTEAQLLAEKKKKADAEAAPADDAVVPADDEAEELPAIVTKVAKKAEGKTGDDLVALLKKVYDAGCKDGMAQAKAEAAE